MNPRMAIACLVTLMHLLPALQGDAMARGERRPLAREAKEATVQATPNKSRVRVGEIVLVTVRIRDAGRVGSAPFTLAYDPGMLEFIPSRSREGSFLASDGASTSFLAKAGRAPGGGTGVIVGASRLGVTRGASGAGVICVLAFRAKTPGVATVSFTRSDLLSPSSMPLSARFVNASLRVEASR